MKPWLKQQWVIPPKANAAFVAHMEDVLEVYHRPHDPARPVVCVDEGGKQLIGDVRPPLPVRVARVAKEDHEYVRGGTANVFLAFEPLGGVRTVEVTQRRGAVDFARFVWHLVMDVYAAAERVILVTDNLSTHSAASFYRAFPPEQARRLAERIEWHFPPVHGSWLNMAEIELSVLARQCLARRIPDQETLTEEVHAWQHARNEEQVWADWQFTMQEARVRLRRLDPSTEMQ